MLCTLHYVRFMNNVETRLEEVITLYRKFTVQRGRGKGRERLRKSESCIAQWYVTSNIPLRKCNGINSAKHNARFMYM